MQSGKGQGKQPGGVAGERVGREAGKKAGEEIAGEDGIEWIGALGSVFLLAMDGNDIEHVGAEPGQQRPF